MPLLRAVVAREAADHGEGLTHPLTPKRGRRFHGDFNGKHREIYSLVYWDIMKHILGYKLDIRKIIDHS